MKPKPAGYEGEYCVSVYVTVSDWDALKNAALARVERDCDYVTVEEMRASMTPEEALRWLIDPGVSPDGCEIQDSTCEAAPCASFS